jgi:hypothetical protein
MGVSFLRQNQNRTCRRKHGRQDSNTLAQTRGKTPIPETGRATVGAVPGENGPIGHDLAVVVKAWAGLPEATRRAVLAMVEGAGDQG